MGTFTERRGGPEDDGSFYLDESLRMALWQRIQRVDDLLRNRWIVPDPDTDSVTVLGPEDLESKDFALRVGADFVLFYAPWGQVFDLLETFLRHIDCTEPGSGLATFAAQLLNLDFSRAKTQYRILGGEVTSI